jgi:hypothetical protein
MNMPDKRSCNRKLTHYPESPGIPRGKISLFFSRHFVYVSPTTCVGCLPWCAEELWIEG